MRAIPLENIPIAAKTRIRMHAGTELNPQAAHKTLREWHDGKPVQSGPTTVGRLHVPRDELASLAEIKTPYGPVYPPHRTPYPDPNFARLTPAQRRTINISDLALRYAVLLDARRSGLIPTDEHDLSRVAAGQYQASDRNLGWHVDGRWRVATRYPGHTAVRYNVVVGEEGITGTNYAVGLQQRSNIDSTGEDTVLPEVPIGSDAELQVQGAQTGDIQRWLSEVDAHSEPSVGEGFRMLVTDSNLLAVWY